MKKISFEFEKESLYYEFIDIIEQTSKKYGEDKFKVNEFNDEILVTVIDKV